MYVHCYHVIITFYYKVSTIHEKKNCKLVIVQEFDWFNKHVVYYFMYE